MTGPSPYPLPKGERDSFTTIFPRAERVLATLSPIGGEGRVRGQVCERPSHYARRLRRSQTDVESKLWSRLRDRGLLLHGNQLVVELDGGQHGLQKRSDAERTAFLAGQGYRVIRFWDNEALTNMEGVLQRIVEALGVKGPSPSPCPLLKGEKVSRTLAPGGGEGRVRGR